MSILQKVRLSAAIVLLCAICLPLSQCAYGLSTETPQAFAHARHLFPRSDKDFQYQYGIKEVAQAFTNAKEHSVTGALTLIAFLWPVALTIWSRKSALPRFWWIFYTSELLLCAGTAYWVYALTQGDRRLYGAYVAEGAIAIYASTTLFFIVDRFRNLFLRRKTKGLIEA